MMAPPIQALKLFHDNNHLCVAIFEEATETSDGWLDNLAWHEVFLTPPENISTEELIPLDQFRQNFTFQPAFAAKWLLVSPQSTAALTTTSKEGSSRPSQKAAQSYKKPISLAQYCKIIAKKTGLTPEEVRNCCEPLLVGIAKQIDSGKPFVSWILTGTPVEESHIQVSDSQVEVPGIKFMRMEVSRGYNRGQKKRK